MHSVGVIGYGYWGPNIVRNFNDLSRARVTAVADARESRLAMVRDRYPGVKTKTNSDDVINDLGVDIVAIATPVSSHFELALKALQAGKHVFVEKPLASSSAEAEILVEEAERRRLVLMVDHTFVYTGAVRKIKELINEGSLGRLYYYDSVRINLGLIQHDVNVIWDLAVHDLAIMQYLLPERPVAVSATGVSHFLGSVENVAYMTLFFESDLIAHVHVNWTSPVKVRRTLVGGSHRMIDYNDLEYSEKVKVYDKGIVIKNDPESAYRSMVNYRTGDMTAPRLDVTEALLVEAEHFIDCIESGAKPLTSGEDGHSVVRVLEAASQSMQDRGRLVRLDQSVLSGAAA